MKIEKIELYHLRMLLKSPFETSFGRIETRDCLLVEVHSEGIVGYGECAADRDPGYSPETSMTAWHILSDFVFPDIWAFEFGAPADLQTLVAGIRGHQMAKAGLEMALWDWFGKRSDQSLSQMLGGDRTKVPVGVSVGLQSSPQYLLETVSDYLDQGYKRVKIKIKPGRDIEDTTIVRKAYPHLALQVDANSAYTLDTIDSLLPLDDLDLLLIEQPLAYDDIWDHHIAQKKFKTPLCLDESIHAVSHARQAIEMEACGIINIKAGRVGGISQGKLIHDLCQDNDIPVWCGGLLETGVGRASNLAIASLPNFTLPGDISASDRYYHQDITHEKFVLNDDSTIDVPALPGLGITINYDAVEKATIKKQTFTP